MNLFDADTKSLKEGDRIRAKMILYDYDENDSLRITAQGDVGVIDAVMEGQYGVYYLVTFPSGVWHYVYPDELNERVVYEVADDLI